MTMSPSLEYVIPLFTQVGARKPTATAPANIKLPISIVVELHIVPKLKSSIFNIANLTK